MSNHQSTGFRCACCCAPSGQPHAVDCRERTNPTPELSLSLPRAAESLAAPLNGIAATFSHDEGAMARCAYCGRYSLNPATLSKLDTQQPLCACGMRHGWSGSFVAPNSASKWSGIAPGFDWQPADEDSPSADAMNGVKNVKPQWIDPRIDFGTPNHKMNGDQSVAVSTEVFWNEDMATCPRGVKVQLLGQGGVALYGAYDGKTPFFIGWAPVPRRRLKREGR